MPTFLRSVTDRHSLRALILEARPLLLLGSRTSTTIPYARMDAYLAEYFPGLDLTLVDTAGMPKSLFVNRDDSGPILEVQGPVTWKEARQYARSQGLDLLAWPTESEASVLAGLATSATGERSFGAGPLREHVLEVVYMDSSGETHSLESSALLSAHALFKEKNNREILEHYQRAFRPYAGFKNAPFPRLERETDLMVGSEGQLGAILSAKIRLQKNTPTAHVFVRLPPWHEDSSLHLGIHAWAQSLRGPLLGVEFMDSASLSMAPQDLLPAGEGDLLLLEVREDALEELAVPGIPAQELWVASAGKAEQVRSAVPRGISEWVARHQALKRGTDAQVAPENFGKLLELYRPWAQESARMGWAYALFGHFGDAHLHFNFLPRGVSQTRRCQGLLDSFYRNLLALGGAPFAEHGWGF